MSVEIQLPERDTVVSLFPETMNVGNYLTLYETNVPASRPVDKDSLDHAAELGYERSPFGVWRALAQHEVLHHVLPPALLKRDSYVLFHKAGIKPADLMDRWYEESLVLAFQRLINTGEIRMPLMPLYKASPGSVGRLRQEMIGYNIKIDQAWHAQYPIIGALRNRN